MQIIQLFLGLSANGPFVENSRVWSLLCPHICILPTEKQEPNKDYIPAPYPEDKAFWKTLLEEATWDWTNVCPAS